MPQWLDDLLGRRRPGERARAAAARSGLDELMAQARPRPRPGEQVRVRAENIPDWDWMAMWASDRLPVQPRRRSLFGAPADPQSGIVDEPA